ncbi:hypothetical protein M432DRAFT_214088 [Thermoascus aurantiacus ATCC 26904]
MASNEPNYNEMLLQINTNLSNTLRTWGSSSHQYQTVLQTLKDCLREIDDTRTAIGTEDQLRHWIQTC